MSIEKDYARALHALATEKPSHVRTYVKNLAVALKRRGHEKLMSRIAAEYDKLELAATRSARHRDVTPERERTRTLLELYQKLISAK